MEIEQTTSSRLPPSAHLPDGAAPADIPTATLSYRFGGAEASLILRLLGWAAILDASIGLSGFLLDVYRTYMNRGFFPFQSLLGRISPVVGVLSVVVSLLAMVGEFIAGLMLLRRKPAARRAMLWSTGAIVATAVLDVTVGLLDRPPGFRMVGTVLIWYVGTVTLTRLRRLVVPLLLLLATAGPTVRAALSEAGGE